MLFRRNKPVVQQADDLDNGSLAWGLILGFLFGAVAALLRAPQSGAATRAQLTGQLNETVSEAGQTVRKQIETVSDSVNETGQNIRKQIENVTETVADTITPADPIAESMAEGKAAARRRRLELGIDSESDDAANPRLNA